ncbi:hypothetical protein RIF29_38437 [Crotalaria pallida]|uniref:Uncharacterized protein n=1 Tax=Crotalaria pallida TaxID=3830 RepID=A0AAN9HNY3_CROPI
MRMRSVGVTIGDILGGHGEKDCEEEPVKGEKVYGEWLRTSYSEKILSQEIKAPHVQENSAIHANAEASNFEETRVIMVPEVADEENRDVDTGYEVDLAQLEAACAPIPGLTFTNKKTWKKLVRNKTKNDAAGMQILGAKRKENDDAVMIDVVQGTQGQLDSPIKKQKGNGGAQDSLLDVAGSGNQTRRSS